MMPREKLVIKIETNEPLELGVITDFLNGVAKEYAFYCKSMFTSLSTSESHLTIHNIKLKGATVLIELEPTNQTGTTLYFFCLNIIRILDNSERHTESDHSIRKLFTLLNFKETHICITRINSTGFWRSLFQRFHAVCVNRT